MAASVAINDLNQDVLFQTLKELSIGEFVRFRQVNRSMDTQIIALEPHLFRWYLQRDFKLEALPMRMDARSVYYGLAYAQRSVRTAVVLNISIPNHIGENPSGYRVLHTSKDETIGTVMRRWIHSPDNENLRDFIRMSGPYEDNGSGPRPLHMEYAEMYLDRPIDNFVELDYEHIVITCKTSTSTTFRLWKDGDWDHPIDL